MKDNFHEQIQVLRAIFSRSNEIVYDDLSERLTYNAFDDQLQCVAFSTNVYANDMIIVDSNVLTNDELKELRAKTYVTTTLYDLFTTLKDYYDHLMMKRTKENLSLIENTVSMLMKIDHMRSPNVYMKHLDQWSNQLSITGRVLVLSHPIFILIEGTNENIRKFIVRLKTETVDIDSRGRPCKERLLTQLIELNNHSSKFTNFQRIEFNNHQELLSYLKNHNYEQLLDCITR
ncbi:hypothetical protein I4U23_025377 [Adineta vaga]|nr:hypothetical protein I4U23_025377 [Adineta vaga]